MRAGANILWFLLGGWLLGASWIFAAVIMTASVIGIPWARACWEIASLSFAPFGRDVISDRELTTKSSMPLGIFRLAANLLWLPFGLCLAIGHLMHGFLMFATIIGIPLGLQCFKLAGISLFPVGKRVVSVELVHEARSENARARLAALRS